jgi:hypothetical protein
VIRGVGEDFVSHVLVDGGVVEELVDVHLGKGVGGEVENAEEALGVATEAFEGG